MRLELRFGLIIALIGRGATPAGEPGGDEAILCVTLSELRKMLV